MEPSSPHALGLAYKLRAERYKKELEVAERKNESLSWANRDISRKLSEANQRGRQLAVTFGFSDIFEADNFVSRNPYALNHFHIGEKALGFRQLETELKEQQEINSRVQRALQPIKEENEALKVELQRLEDRLSSSDSRTLRDMPIVSHPHTSSDIKISAPRSLVSSQSGDLPADVTSLRHELIDLRHRYDALLEAKEKAAAMYKKDYKKWRDYKRQVYEEAVRDKKGYRNAKGSTKRKKHNNPSMRLEAQEDIKPILEIDMHVNHEIEQTPRPRSRATEQADKENYISTPTTGCVCVQHANIPPSSVTSMRPSHVPVLHLASPSCVRSDSTYPLDQSYVLLGEPARHTLSDSPVPTSSISSSKLKRKHSEPKVAPAPSPSSETEDDSQASPKKPFAFRPPTLLVPQKDQPLLSVISWSSFQTKGPTANHSPIPANNDIPTYNALSRPTESRHTFTPNNEEPLTSLRRFDAWDRSRNSKTDIRGKEISQRSTDRHIGSMSKDSGIDYSEYKGRGRYAQTVQNGNTTINAQYEIDMSQNNGLDFQYHAAVRNRQERKHLNAGDCECCRDYYEAIGPLPPRLQPPPWRSPDGSPVASRTCQHHSPCFEKDSFSGRQRDNDIAQHKKDISRHRHNWERAGTPPGYWNIGFPSTQDASDINEKAKEMHRQKLVMVEREASKMDGRYRKR